MIHLGIHVIADFFRCDPSVINSAESVERIMIEAVNISGATIIKPFFHRFSPHGISGIIVVAESHFAIHTWPEHSAAAVDIFSCGDFNYTDALIHIRNSISSEDNTIIRILRGNTTGDKGPDKHRSYTEILL